MSDGIRTMQENCRRGRFVFTLSWSRGHSSVLTIAARLCRCATRGPERRQTTIQW